MEGCSVFNKGCCKVDKKKGYSLKYLIIGEGEERNKLEKLAGELDIADKVIFAGNIKNSELPKYYSIAHVAVFPSIANETFGISIAEAMACGVPVISTRVGGIPEVVSEGTGILVPPKDEDAIAEAMEGLIILDAGLRRDMGLRARKWIEENFNWDEIAKRFERYINNA